MHNFRFKDLLDFYVEIRADIKEKLSCEENSLY